MYPLSPRRTVPASIPRPEYAADGIPRSEQKFVGRHQITILNEKDQAAMRKVCRLAREVLDAAAREVKPGVTTDYIDGVVHRACVERDVRFPFPTIFLGLKNKRRSMFAMLTTPLVLSFTPKLYAIP